LLADQADAYGAENTKTAADPVETCSRVCVLVASALNDATGFFAFVLCYVLWLQFIWLARQEGVLRQSVSALPNIERAYVFARIEPDEPRPGDAPRQRGAVLIVENHGKTPAIVTRIYGHVEKIAASDYPDGVTEAMRTLIPPGIVIRAGGDRQMAFPYPALTNLDWENVAHGQSALIAYGRIEYEDVLGNARETGFCWELQPADTGGAFYVSPTYRLNYYT
jgi:hypothetical protein